MDVKHEPLRIKHPKHVRVSSEGRYDEAQEEDQDDKGQQGDQGADTQFQQAEDMPQQQSPETARGFVPNDERDVSNVSLNVKW